MVKLNNNFNPNSGQNQFNQGSQAQSQNSQTDNSQAQPNQTQSNQQKGLFSLPSSVMNFVPWIPFALEAMTGQKVPQMGGTVAEIQQGIQTIQFNLSQIITNQQQIWTRLENLEKNAINQFTNLTQAFQSLRLIHTREKKQIDFNRSQSTPETEEENENY